ncbi:hypothetical protein BDZ91DRAFT_793267 [Kalaharituber pfeilii]|nr:hypothetical protein BDZ91DRAFT_793267 [Kalaharituber pfeilii]
MDFYSMETSTLITIIIFVSVNPDDHYKVIVFGLDVFRIDGRTLDYVCRDPGNIHSVSDVLLRWYFHQSILANMRRAGEPVFEYDFTGSDTMAVISQEPYGKKRLV